MLTKMNPHVNVLKTLISPLKIVSHCQRIKRVLLKYLQLTVSNKYTHWIKTCRRAVGIDLSLWRIV